MTYQVIDRATGEVILTCIDMQEGRYWGDCIMCREYRRLDHAVGYYCGPTLDDIGSVSTEYISGTDEPAIVGGMCVCRKCHDRHYGVGK
jgi:hypothetical protein